MNTVVKAGALLTPSGFVSNGLVGIAGGHHCRTAAARSRFNSYRPERVARPARLIDIAHSRGTGTGSDLWRDSPSHSDNVPVSWIYGRG